MKITLIETKWKKEEIGSHEYEISDEPAYFFETGIRRAIRIIPLFTNWNVEFKGEPEYIFEYHITMVYQSWESKIESFSLTPEKITEAYYDNKNKHHEFVRLWVTNQLDKRTKERFDQDVLSCFNNIQRHENRTNKAGAN